MVIWYQSVQVLSPTPPLPGGGLAGPPEVAGIPPPLVEAGLLLWQGVDDFPPWLGVVDFLPWPEVDGCPPWFKVDPCPLPLGLVEPCPVAFQRLQQLESWFGPASVGEVDH